MATEGQLATLWDLLMGFSKLFGFNTSWSQGNIAQTGSLIIQLTSSPICLCIYLFRTVKILKLEHKPFRVAMTTGHSALISDYSCTILASGMNFDCYGNITDITSILFGSYFVLKEPLCLWSVRKLRTVSCIREKLLGAKRNGLSPFKEYSTSRSDWLSALIRLGSWAS